MRCIVKLNKFRQLPPSLRKRILDGVPVELNLGEYQACRRAGQVTIIDDDKDIEVNTPSVPEVDNTPSEPLDPVAPCDANKDDTVDVDTDDNQVPVDEIPVVEEDTTAAPEIELMVTSESEETVDNETPVEEESSTEEEIVTEEANIDIEDKAETSAATSYYPNRPQYNGQKKKKKK